MVICFVDFGFSFECFSGRSHVGIKGLCVVETSHCTKNEVFH